MLLAIPGWAISPAIVFLKWLRGLFAVSKANFGDPYNGASEPDLKHIHLPVLVKANYFGKEAIQGAEPWVIFGRGELMEIKLLWRNENDSAGPVASIYLRAGRTYHIPFVARTTVSSLPLSGSATIDVPYELYSDWVLAAGIPRITNGNHYFTFTGLTNLKESGVYSVKLEIRASNGKIILANKYWLYVPKVDASNDSFKVTAAD